MATVTVGNTDYARACKILIDHSGEMVRDVLSVLLPPTAIPPTGNLKLNAQQKLVYNNIWNVHDYNSCDLSLMYVIIRNLCGIAPTSRWGQPVSPASVTLADDIERLRLLRNETYGHLPTASLTKVEYGSFIQTMAAITTRFDRCHNK